MNNSKTGYFGQQIFKSTAILAFSAVAVKVLSAAYRIPLTRMLGAEGMGRYTASFNILMPFFSFATAGITPTVSRLCASVKNADSGIVIKIKKKAFVCFGTTVFLCAGAALALAAVYGYRWDSFMTFAGVAILCPNMIFAAFEGVYKGVSQGTMDMITTAKANMLESACKVVLGICSVYLAGTLLKGDAAFNAQLICAFCTVSICGFICLVYMKRNFAAKYQNARHSDFKVSAGSLFSVAIPISLSALLVSAANFFDTVVCLSIIKQIPDGVLMGSYPFAVFSAREEKAVWLFGVYQGLCLSVVNLIPSLSAAVGQAGLPHITKSLRRSDTKTAAKDTDKIIKLTCAISVPVSLFVMFFREDVLTGLYSDSGSRTVLAAYFLKFMAPMAVLSSFSFPLNSLLHAMGCSKTITGILMIACCIKVALGGFLCRIPRVNIMGCIFSQIVFGTVVFLLSVYNVRSIYSPKKLFGSLIIPFALSYILLSFVRAADFYVLYNVPVLFKTVFTGGVYISIYGFLLILSGFFVDKNSRK